MIRFSKSCALTLAALTLLATGAVAHAEERPLKGTVDGVFDYYSSNLYGSGEMPHLGRSTLHVGYYPSGLGLLENGLFLPWYGYQYSADGDRLNFAFDAPIYEFDPAIGVINTTVTFIGGTGRFEDATGSADVTFVFQPYFFDYSGSSYSILIDGSIDY